VQIQQDQVGLVLGGQVQAQLGSHRADQRDAGPAPERPLDPEAAPLADRTGHPEGSAHRLGQALGQRKAETSALRRGLLPAQPLEGHEQPLQGCRWDAGPGVADRDPQPLARDPLAPEADSAARTVVLDRVGQQVQQDLLEALPVAEDMVVAGRLGAVQHDALLRRAPR
jgi:hypothetical protein